jgi:hypothetical protein
MNMPSEPRKPFTQLWAEVSLTCSLGLASATPPGLADAPERSQLALGAFFCSASFAIK